jgi:hypothetical protein
VHVGLAIGASFGLTYVALLRFVAVPLLIQPYLLSSPLGRWLRLRDYEHVHDGDLLLLFCH